jgi:hypothetical protein
MRRRSTKTQVPVTQADVGEDAEALAVLRLDDVPWDVTPSMLSSWAGVPSYQAHVLLDRDGKTLSHAFIEARQGSGEDKDRILVECKNKVLGSGKRARRVTITMSGQDELLQAVSILSENSLSSLFALEDVV